MKTWYFFAGLLAVCTAQADTVYRCTSGTNAVYTDSPAQAVCSPAALSGAALLSYDKPAATQAGSTAAQAKSNKAAALARAAEHKRQTKALKAAEQKLQKAQAALKRGKTVRQGGNRNDARHRERIRKLENAVETAQKDLNQLRAAE